MLQYCNIDDAAAPQRFAIIKASYRKWHVSCFCNAHSKTRCHGNGLLKSFEAIAEQLGPDKTRALIILEIGGGRQGIEQALTLINAETDKNHDFKILAEQPSQVALVSLDPGKAPDLVMRLIEAGYTTMKAVYPQQGR